MYVACLTCIGQDCYRLYIKYLQGSPRAFLNDYLLVARTEKKKSPPWKKMTFKESQYWLPVFYQVTVRSRDREKVAWGFKGAETIQKAVDHILGNTQIHKLITQFGW